MGRRNKDLPLLEQVTITDAGAEGMAVAKVDGLVVFVPFVVPGDVVDIQLYRKKKNYAEGRATAFHKYSDLRVEPRCPHFGVCGGCKWQTMAYSAQLDAKQRQVRDNLERLRALAPVHTACAHGSPRSPWNSQDIWNQHDIHSLGIDYEPMLDTDFSSTLYLTDTGRLWDGYRVSVRDKVPQYQEQWEREGLAFRTTDDIIHAISNLDHPIHQKSLLLNTHPQRWMPFGPQWMAEACLQYCKNIAKRLIVKQQRTTP